MPTDSWRPIAEHRPDAPTACTILCDGPSMAQFDAERDLIAGAPVVSVNTAQAIYRGEVWCVHSGYGQLTSRLADYGMTPELCVPDEMWFRTQWAEPNSPEQHDLAKKAQRTRTWASRVGPMANILGWVSRVEWGAVAPLAAAAIAINLGVKRIRIVGADMKGSGYGGIDSGVWRWRPEEDDEIARKWKRERVAMQYAIAEARERGIEIERWTPGAPVSAPAPKAEKRETVKA